LRESYSRVASSYSPFMGEREKSILSEWFGQPVAVDATLFEGEEMEQYARQAGLCDVEVVERPPYAFEYQSRRLYLFARVIPRFLS